MYASRWPGTGAMIALCLSGMISQSTALAQPASELVRTPDGVELALDADGRPWIRRDVLASWGTLPGRFLALRTGQDSSIWGLTQDGDLMQLMPARWWRKVAEGIKDVAVGPDGRLLALDSRLQLIERSPGDSDWGRIATLPDTHGLSRVSADEHGLPWLWSPDGRVLRFDGTQWLRTDVPIRTLSVLRIDLFGNARASDGLGQSWLWVPAAKSWHTVSLDTPLDSIADTQLHKPPALFTRLLSWQRVRGQARTVAVGADGTVVSIDAEENLWLWKGKDNWTLLPGRMSRVAVGPNGTVWGLTAAGRLARFDGGYWTNFTIDAKGLAISPLGDVWLISTEGRIGTYKIERQQWIPFLSGDVRALGLSIGKEGEPWIVDNNRRVRGFVSGSWRLYPGIEVTSLGVGPDGTVYATTALSEIYWLDIREQLWKPATGKANFVAVGPNGAPWAIGERNELLASTQFLTDSDRRTENFLAAVTPPDRPVFTLPPPATVLPTITRTLTYVELAGNYVDVGVGADGSVFAAGSDGGLYCFNDGDRKFILASPGTARRLINAGGTPWVVNGQGAVSRFVGSQSGGSWVSVPDFRAADISVSQTGEVLAISVENQLVHQFNPRNGFFELVVGNGGQPLPKAQRVAAAGGAVFWLVTPSQQLLRCRGGQCVTQAVTARGVSVGPEGTVQIIDGEGNLRRIDPRNQSFIAAGGAGQELSVGPQGLPWLIGRAGTVLASQFFAPTARGTRASSPCNQRFASQAIPEIPKSGPLVANSDTAVLPAGGTLNLLANDSFNGQPTFASQVNLFFSSPSALLSQSNGVVSVSPEARPGSQLTASYRICQRPPSVLCSSTVSVSITVPSISVQPDRKSVV